MRRLTLIGVVLSLVALAVAPSPAAAEVEQAVIAILGGMQCSL
jgi:hypothetical protein